VSMDRAVDVLIVDDSSVARSIIERALSLGRLHVSNVYQASNGKEGLEVLRAKKVDLVITDVNMPVMTGLQMVEAMSSSPALRNMPIIIVSSNPSGEMPRSARVRALCKPFTPETLVRLVKEVIETA